MIRINLLPQEERVQRKKGLALPAMGMVVPFVGVGLASAVGTWLYSMWVRKAEAGI